MMSSETISPIRGFRLSPLPRPQVLRQIADEIGLAIEALCAAFGKSRTSISVQKLDEWPCAAPVGPLCLVLPSSSGVTRRFTAPRSAHRHIDQIIGNQINQLTPFEPAEVFFGHRSQRRDDGRLDVELAMAPVATIDAVVAKADKFGLSVSGLVLETCPHIDLLPARHRSRTFSHLLGQRLLRWNGILLLSLLGLLLVGGGARWVVAYAAKERAAVEVAQIIDASKRAEAAVTDIAPLSARLAKSARTVEHLDALAQALSARTYISKINIAGDRLEITGVTDNAAQVLSTIDQLDGFQDARFMSSVVRDPATNTERYHIVARRHFEVRSVVR